MNVYKNNTIDNTYFPSRACTKKEVTDELWFNDYLFICGDFEKLTLLGNFNILPYNTF